MTENVPAASTIQSDACAFPGCEEPAERSAGPGRPRKFCARPDHNAQTSYREKEKKQSGIGQAESPADMGRPVTMARAQANLTRSRLVELLEQLPGLLDRLAEVETVAKDPDAVDAQIEAVTTDAEQRISTAEATRAVEHTRRLAAESATAEAREAADDMAAQIDVIQARLHETQTERDEAKEQIAELNKQLTKLEQIKQDRDELQVRLVATTNEHNAIQAENIQLASQIKAAQRETQTEATRAERAETNASEQKHARIKAEQARIKAEQAHREAEQAHKEAELRAQTAQSAAHRSADALTAMKARLTDANAERDRALTAAERSAQLTTLLAQLGGAANQTKR